MQHRFLFILRLLAAFFGLFTRYPDYYPDGGNYIQLKEQHRSIQHA